jgi:propane 2-monooxygenase small subunit
MQSWLDTWGPVSLAAARSLQPVWSQPGEKVIRFEDSLDRTRRRLHEVLAELNLDGKDLA